MDFKRNTRYFSQTFARNLTILSIVGGALAVVGGLVWWYIYLGSFAILVEIAAIAGAVMLIGSISIRPSEKYLFEQIETAEKQFREEALDTFKNPANAEDCTRLVWGFSEGTAKKTTKGGKIVTDQVEFALLWLRRGELAVYRRTSSLQKEESCDSDVRLSLSTLTAISDWEAGTLTLQTAEETVILPVFEPDYKLEEFLEQLEHLKK